MRGAVSDRVADGVGDVVADRDTVAETVAGCVDDSVTNEVCVDDGDGDVDAAAVREVVGVGDRYWDRNEDMDGVLVRDIDGGGVMDGVTGGVIVESV